MRQTRAARLRCVIDAKRRMFDIPDDTGAGIPSNDPDWPAVEHFCHEVAHALLLRLRLRDSLPKRISAALTIRHDPLFSDMNEVQAFAVVIAALRRLGVPAKQAVMVDALTVQVGHTMAAAAPRYWKKFQATKRCQRAVERLVALFEEKQ